MTPQQLSDRLEIQDTLVRYCHAVDRRDWPAFEAVFTDDALLDFTAFGGPRGNRSEMARYLESVIATMQGTQHTISTSLVELAGDTATARTAAQVMMISATEGCGSHVLFVGLWYRDRLRRTAQGWRIFERVQEFGWVHNAPPA
ncbi:nuclear transport factor 2 family protein [Sinimarinibacterium sp. CAU 1509]|uniref:nuclear transport factor 2 family protein n=1 Tax=Sinimarinibacterium sp. CAU 1509 TaxID=2562283 RepID=UPI0010AC9F13|nr:nuclear transport factor 2 family protein [Sinimarinibacterium sp. CAU 1509]TJY59997.1 nuclear transport factor 2 family protein [Sinimarinibacterium sp. CAU 1509]